VFGGAATLAATTSPATLASGRREGQGLGWALARFRGRRLAWHAGGIPGFSAFLLSALDDDLDVVILANLEGFDCAGPALRIVEDTLRLPAPSLPAPRPVAPGVLADSAGKYRDGPDGVVIRPDGALLVVTHGPRVLHMTLVGDGLFADRDDPDVTLRFHPGSERACTLAYPPFWSTFHRVGDAEP
jgi:hypothetical protein